jgi:hypothetical protein
LDADGLDADDVPHISYTLITMPGKEDRIFLSRLVNEKLFRSTNRRIISFPKEDPISKEINYYFYPQEHTQFTPSLQSYGFKISPYDD